MDLLCQYGLDIQDLGITNGRMTALSGSHFYQRFDNTFISNKIGPEGNVFLYNGSYTWVANTRLGISRHEYTRNEFQSFMPSGPTSDLTVKSNLHEGSAFFLNAFGFSRLDLENRSWRADNGGFIESRTLTDLDFEVRPRLLH